MGEKRRHQDELELAEQRATILLRTDSAEDFPLVGAGGLAVLTIFLDRIEALQRRIDALEAARPQADRPGTSVIDRAG